MEKKKQEENSIFSFKIKFVKKRNYNKDKIELIHDTNGHNKFYHMNVERKESSRPRVVINYGRIRSEMVTSGTTEIKEFKNLDECYKFVNKKLEEKTNKGYKRIEN
jgi:predicted DNA-binding WGR domain protein